MCSHFIHPASVPNATHLQVEMHICISFFFAFSAAFLKLWRNIRLAIESSRQSSSSILC